MSNMFIVDGDRHSHGGLVFASTAKAYVKGRRIVCEDDEAVCQIHGRTRVAKSASWVDSSGKRWARHGDTLECGSTLIASQLKVDSR